MLMGSHISKYFDNTKLLTIFFGWTALFLATLWAYWPGLPGPFVFDDYGNISKLGDFGGVRDWDTFRAYVFGGLSGPTGRPLSLLTFLIDANDWPTESFPFKRTNLVIHLINGALIGTLISKILKLLDYEVSRARSIALISTAFWLLHPFLVSTTLYAVQRMAQLSTLFIFGGLIGHLYARSLLQRNASKAYVMMTLSVGVFTLLAMLSKENGILLPLLIGVLEFTILASQRERIAALDRRWATLFIVVPSLVIVGYIGQNAFRPNFFDILAPREFSLYERALTQPRILFDYLQHWFIPSLYTTGVFQDHFIKSTGMLTPITTLLTAIFHLILILVAVLKRGRWPIFSFAILFFYGSHVLESTILNLELYFEHRNYLAAGFLFLPLIAALERHTSRKTFAIIAIVMLIVLASFTRYSATVWSSFPSIVEASARKAPTSARAQAQYADMLFSAGRKEEALEVLDNAIEIIPVNNALLLTNRLILLCETNMLEREEFDRNAKIITSLPYDFRLLKTYSTFIERVIEQRCANISVESLAPIFIKMLQLPRHSNPMSLEFMQLKYLTGYVHLYSGKPEMAVAAFSESLRSRPGASYAMAMAAMLATKNYLDEALSFSNEALRQLDAEEKLPMIGLSVNRSDILEFQATIRAEISARQDADNADEER
jgi:tetratricopeptide (TPR) repeat protein